MPENEGPRQPEANTADAASKAPAAVPQSAQPGKVDAAAPAATPPAPAKRRASKPRAAKLDSAVAKATERKAAPVKRAAKRMKPKKTVRRAAVTATPAAAKARVVARANQTKPVQKRIRTIMATATKGSKAEVAGFVADVQDKAKFAYEKSTVAAGKVGNLVKDNADALVASGKTLGAGLKDIGQGQIADSRKAVATFADDLKALAAVKSTSDLLTLQGQLAGRNFDAALGFYAKNGQALRDLAGKAFAPLSLRVKSNLEVVRKAA